MDDAYESLYFGGKGMRMTVKQYRLMDVCLFTALLCLFEGLIVLAATRWFPQEPYTLSLTPAITAVVMVRWGAMAAFPAGLGGFVFCLLSGAAPVQYVLYCAGNMLALMLLLFIKRVGWKRLHKNVLLALVYGALTALLMQVGRAALALIMGSAPGVCAGFMTTDVLSTLFSALIIWICRRLDGMLEEQIHYLTRIHEEMIRAGGIRA